MNPVYEITYEEYKRLGGIDKRKSLAEAFRDKPVTTEKAWFKCGAVLGIVLLDNVDDDWSYVVLGRHPDRGNAYRAIDVRTSLPTVAAATEQLKTRMQVAASAWNRFRDTHTPDPKS